MQGKPVLIIEAFDGLLALEYALSSEFIIRSGRLRIALTQSCWDIGDAFLIRDAVKTEHAVDFWERSTV
jgi:hypothetical protein